MPLLPTYLYLDRHPSSSAEAPWRIGLCLVSPAASERHECWVLWLLLGFGASHLGKVKKPNHDRTVYMLLTDGPCVFQEMYSSTDFSIAQHCSVGTLREYLSSRTISCLQVMGQTEFNGCPAQMTEDYTGTQQSRPPPWDRKCPLRSRSIVERRKAGFREPSVVIYKRTNYQNFRCAICD